MSDDGVVEVSVHIAASPETVFPYFTDPSRYVQWMGSGATLEPVPGGAYRIQMRGGVEAAGRFIEISPPHRLVFTWGWTHDPAVPPGTTRVVVTLQPEDGGTRVVLRHHDLPDDKQAEHHERGWEFYSRPARTPGPGRGSRPGPEHLTTRSRDHGQLHVGLGSCRRFRSGHCRRGAAVTLAALAGRGFP